MLQKKKQEQDNMQGKNYISVLCFALCCLNSVAQKQYTHIALLNGVAHIGNGQVIEGSLISINNGKIETVSETKGLRLDYRSFDTVIDLEGKHVYPALINCNNVLGLHDAEAIRATVDFHEVGNINPHVRALIAYNTDNLIIPTIKTNGVLYTQATPRSGLISGSSSIMALEGWNWEDAVLKADDGIHINFPRMTIHKWSEEEEAVAKVTNKKYTEEMSHLLKFLSDAQAYCSGAAAEEKNIRFEAMRGVFSGSANLYIRADRAKDILVAINVVAKYKIKRPVIVGGKESYKVTADLHKNNIPVMLNRVNDLPDYADDDVDLVYRLPYLLQKDSVLFCFQMEGDMEAMHSRNLPFNAGESVAYGLTKEQALMGITSNPAKILGVDKLIGTIEEGKIASLVVSTGDILDMKSNNIVMAYIAGNAVNLNNRQSELYLKYKTKYGIK
ncbi:MAG: amidohydrolase family protein [Bacteroidia bacterium]|nr:amidohydrolase family protein [Bacteroidia bacterium]